MTARSAVAAEHADSPTSIQDPFARLGWPRPRPGAGSRQQRRERGWPCHQNDSTPSLSRPTAVLRPSRTPPQSLTNTAESPTRRGPWCPTADNLLRRCTPSVEGVAAVQAEYQPPLGPSRQCVREKPVIGHAKRSFVALEPARTHARSGGSTPETGPLTGLGDALSHYGHLAANVTADAPPATATHPSIRSPPAKTPAEARNRQRSGGWKRSGGVPVAFGATQQPAAVPSVERSDSRVAP